MRFKTLSIVLVCALTSMMVSAQTNFRHITFEEALTAAKAEKKLVFIDFYTTWCGPCKKMANEVFPQKEVGDFMNPKFVCVKFDAEKEGADLAKKYGVNAFPTFVIVDANGNAVGEFKGSMSPEALQEKINVALNPELSAQRMKERYEKGERTPELINSYALHVLQNSQSDEEGLKIVNDYFNSLSDKERLKAENAFLYIRYTMSYQEPMGKFMAAHQKDFPKSVRPAIDDRLAQLYRSAVSGYFSGYMLRENKYVESEYQALKKTVTEMGLEPERNAVKFRLIEGRVALNDNDYWELCQKEFDNLADVDQSLFLMNITRLFMDSDMETNTKIAQFFRGRLATMKPDMITVAGRILGSLEREK